jgi:hypothetical protein
VCACVCACVCVCLVDVITDHRVTAPVPLQLHLQGGRYISRTNEVIRARRLSRVRNKVSRVSRVIRVSR